MPRTVIPITALPVNAGTVEVAGTAMDAVNGQVINVDGNCRGLLIKMLSTGPAAPEVITIPAPVGDAHALRSRLGDLTITLDAAVAANDEGYVIVESSQFTHPAEGAVGAAAGSIRQIFIDYDAAQTGVVWAYRLPRNV